MGSEEADIEGQMEELHIPTRMLRRKDAASRYAPQTNLIKKAPVKTVLAHPMRAPDVWGGELPC